MLIYHAFPYSTFPLHPAIHPLSQPILTPNSSHMAAWSGRCGVMFLPLWVPLWHHPKSKSMCRAWVDLGNTTTWLGLGKALGFG